ncbi:MAG: hypothetical protein HUJ59_00545 [Bacilli bacterium]|nr:hypothetical protein [Bacilli bacterium]
MNTHIQYILIAFSIAFLISSLILRLCKKKTVGKWLELAGIGFFIAFASQYSWWLGNLAHIDARGVAELLLFFFAVLMGIYRFLFFFIYPKR